MKDDSHCHDGWTSSESWLCGQWDMCIESSHIVFPASSSLKVQTLCKAIIHRKLIKLLLPVFSATENHAYLIRDALIVTGMRKTARFCRITLTVSAVYLYMEHCDIHLNSETRLFPSSMNQLFLSKSVEWMLHAFIQLLMIQLQLQWFSYSLIEPFV